MCFLVLSSILLFVCSAVLVVLLAVYDYTGFGEGRIAQVNSCPSNYLNEKYIATNLSSQQQIATIAISIASAMAIANMLLMLAWSGKRCALPTDITRSTKSLLIFLGMLCTMASLPPLGFCASWLL